MKILLLYPTREEYIFETVPYTHIEADSGYYPPIGLLYISAYIEKFSKHTVKVCDAYTDKMTHEDIEKLIISYKPDVLGIYFSTYYLSDSITVARMAKKISNDITVIAGGPHAVVYPSETIAVDAVDYVMSGDSEISFTQLLSYLEIKDFDAIESMANVLSKKSANDKQIIRERVENLDELPFPSRHLLDYKKYSSILVKRNPMTTVITSRGCAYNCFFCSNIESGQNVRFRSPENVVDELQEIVEKFGIYDFLFFDELFTLKKKRVLEICDEILKRKLKIRWHCRSRVDVLDEEMVKKMKKAGCRLIQFGIETGTARMQQVINKKLDLDKVREIIKIVYKSGIYTYADFIFNLPTETDEEMQGTIDFAKSLKLDYAIFGSFHPIPNSVFYEQGLKEGLFPDYWADFVKNPDVTIKDNSWNRKDFMKNNEIVSRAFKEFYLRPIYMLTHLFRIDSFAQFKWQFISGIKVFSKFF